MENPTAQASVEIAASPELVYRLVSDVPNLPAWAVETDRCEWTGGATGPEVGATFRGRNRHRGRRWSTTCRVIAADPGRRFAFQVHTARVVPSSQWEYEIEPTATGCRVTERTRRLLPRLVARASNLALGVPRGDRDAHNQRNIEQTLTRLKEHAEAAARKA